jgi:putative heme-binding domain-containing protein
MLTKFHICFGRNRIVTALACVPFLCAAIGISLFAQVKTAATQLAGDASPSAGDQRTFESVCASCHGLDGRGGERGPDISLRSEMVRKTDAQLMRILQDGRTAAGMPSFASFGSPKLAALVKYLRTLQGRPKETKLPGNSQKGKALFYGKAKCSDCHMVSGHGGFFGQDLTNYALRRSAVEVRAAILNPNKDLDPRRGLIVVVLSDATRLSGMARNEDNFSLQLQTADGAFHLLNKSDIRELNYTGATGMPSDYGAALSASELEDLVSFLLRSSGVASMEKSSDDSEHDEEE